MLQLNRYRRTSMNRRKKIKTKNIGGSGFRVPGSGLDLNPTAYIGRFIIYFYFFHLTFFLPLQKKVKSLFSFFLKKSSPYYGGSKSNQQLATSNLLKRNRPTTNNLELIIISLFSLTIISLFSKYILFYNCII